MKLCIVSLYHVFAFHIFSYLTISISINLYIYIYPNWCIEMGHQWYFLWVHEVGFGSCNIRPPRPNDPVGIDLTPTPIPAANLRIFHTRQMTAEMALFMGITFEFWQRPIRVCLLWRLLKLPLKLWGHFALVFPAAMTSLSSSLFNLVWLFFPSLPETSLQLTIKNTVHEYKIVIKTNRLRFKIEIYVRIFFLKFNYKNNTPWIYNYELNKDTYCYWNIFLKFLYRMFCEKED